MLQSKRSGYLRFLNDTNISNLNGYPKDSLTYYFPPASFTDSCWSIFDPIRNKFYYPRKLGITKEQLSKSWNVPLEYIHETTKIDSFLLKLCSYHLYKLQVPVLHNYYLGKSIYRLFTVPGLGGSTSIITLVADKNSFYVVTKELDHPIEDPFEIVHYIDTNGIDSIVPYKPKPNPYTINDTEFISKYDFMQIDSLIRDSNFINSPFYYNDITSTDAYGVLFEIHNENGYYYSFRWDPRPNTPFRKVIDLFRSLSNIDKKEIAYYEKVYYGKNTK